VDSVELLRYPDIQTMPLKLGPIQTQIEQLAQAITAGDRQHLLAEARALLHQADPQAVREALLRREPGGRPRIPWLVANPLHTFDATFPAPPPPADFSVVAADGSSIPPDRHSPVRFYVLNLGWAVLTYGSHPDAILDSQGRLCFTDEDLYISLGGDNIPIEGARLGIKMGVEELRALREALPLASAPAVALRDGSLILWALQNEVEAVQTAFLKQFREHLNAFREAGVPIASYISYTGSQDLANALRVWLCPGMPGHCDTCPLPADRQTLCRFLGTLRDRELMEGLLGEGERSDVFASTSAILEKYGNEHRVQFFYLNVGGEIARVEAPRWVMEDAALLERVHGVLMDQCRRSGGYPPYPPALQEAHEQAVITTAERQVVEDLVAEALAARGVVYVRSAKDRSKRRRGA